MAESRVCPACDGDGVIYVRNHRSIHYATSDSALYDVHTCRACGGRGEVEADTTADANERDRDMDTHGPTVRPTATPAYSE